LALAIPTLPWSGALTRESTAESMRLMKQLATEAMRAISPPAASRSSNPDMMYASTTCS
jgi:prephenate dehydratase